MKTEVWFLPGQGQGQPAPCAPSPGGQGTFPRDTDPTFIAFDAHSPCIHPDSARCVFSGPSPNCSLSVPTPNHGEMTEIRKIFSHSPSYPTVPALWRPSSSGWGQQARLEPACQQPLSSWASKLSHLWNKSRFRENILGGWLTPKVTFVTIFHFEKRQKVLGTLLMTCLRHMRDYGKIY